MKKILILKWMNFRLPVFILLSFAVFPYACVKPYNNHGGNNNDGEGLKVFNQINLVANNAEYNAAHIDSALVNAWGLAFSPTGTPWLSSQGGHVSTVYNNEGVTVLGPVNIPSPGGTEGGNPSGIIFNGVGADFLIPAGNGTADAAARFIFVGLDGIVSAWNGTWGTHAYSKFNNVATSTYTGLALAAKDGSNYLYAADFRGNKIAVWDRTWAPVAMAFSDPGLPSGYAPFNIQAVNDVLFVTYAKVGVDGRSEAGVGKGIVNVFKTDGTFLKRFASKDKLNAPWGVAMAPPSFFPKKIGSNSGNGGQSGGNDQQTDPTLLVGNFGDGKINVYSLEGKFLGFLKSKEEIIKIEGLWAISFAPITSAIPRNRLYFAAGPDEETHGLFGYVIKDSTSNSGHY